MKILFYLGHPAHYHLFKNILKRLMIKNHNVKVLVKKKDVLEDLLENDGIDYMNILSEVRSNSKWGMGWAMLKKDWRIFKICLTFKPDLMVGTPPELGHIGTLMKIPTIHVNEDDQHIYNFASKYLTYPWADYILSPTSCDNGKWNYKSIKYNGYHELAYLHPNHFSASKKIVHLYFPTNEPYFIIRFAKLTAHHDEGIQGISNKLAQKIIAILNSKGNVFITSERELPSELESYRMAINPLDIHHVLAFASLYIGDSQTMAAESAVLGTPFVRFNDFVGRIGYLQELEQKYKLGFGIKTNEPEKLLDTIQNLADTEDLKQNFIAHRNKMLNDKIDVSKLFTWMIENFPDSLSILENNPEYQKKFV